MSRYRKRKSKLLLDTPFVFAFGHIDKKGFGFPAIYYKKTNKKESDLSFHF